MIVRSKKAGIIVAAVAVFVVSTIIVSLTNQSVTALSGGEFQAGRIIDDNVFFNGDAMSASQIQTFLNAKMPSCDTNGQITLYDSAYGDTVTRKVYSERRGVSTPFICLKDYRMDVPSKSPEDSLCNGITAGTQRTAAQIIDQVSRSCGVSQKALIVLLQKEQSLITDDWPWPIQYRSATGYGCPDTAACDSTYYGFFNQVYMAARVFKYYANYPNSFNHIAGRNNNILYNPNSACGSSTVFIENQATAGLYNYTPYQPNAAALNNLYGTGDGCSAYGNRNFWRMYNDWFGNTLSTPAYTWSLVSQVAFSDAAFTNQLPYTISIEPGQKAYMRIRAKNTGNQVWDSRYKLATTRERNRTSLFKDSSWLTINRAAALKEASVFPGETGTFEFSITAPYDMKSYKEYFSMVAEGKVWLNDIGLYYPINVESEDPFYLTSIVERSMFLDSARTQQLAPNMLNSIYGEKLYARVKVKNVGNRDLLKSNARLGTTNPRDRASVFRDSSWISGNRAAILSEETVAPGATGTYEFSMTAPSSSADYSESFGVVIEAITWADTNFATYNFKVSADVLSIVKSGQRLYPGQHIKASNAAYRLVMQNDGNLVLYSNTKALWHTQTQGKSVSHLLLQDDGNLVLYEQGGKALWNSRTNGRGSSRLIMQDDGNLVLYDTQNKATWHTNTRGK
jgi:hypothetical protein